MSMTKEQFDIDQESDGDSDDDESDESDDCNDYDWLIYIDIKTIISYNNHLRLFRSE